MEGPIITDRTSSPATVVTVKRDLSPGTSIVTDKAHSGFSTTWYRTVTYQTGESHKETIFSKFKAMPEKIIVSPDLAPASGVQPGI